MLKSAALAFLMLFSATFAMGQTAGVLYLQIGKTKAEIQQQLKRLTLIKDWGPGKSMDYEEPGSTTIKLRFDQADRCIGASYMSFEPHPERFQAEVEAMAADGWEIDKTWKAGQSTHYRYHKGELQFCAHGHEQVFSIGTPESSKWPLPPGEAPAEVPQMLSEQEMAAIISAYGGTILLVTKREGDQATVEMRAGVKNHTIGDKGEANKISLRSSMTIKLRLGELAVVSVDGNTMTMKIIDSMQMNVDGVAVDMFKVGTEFHWDSLD